RKILPGGEPWGTSFVPTFVNMFFGAGLCEEALKATPILLALLLAYRLGGPSDKPTPSLLQLLTGKASMSDILGALAIRGPLDGLLMGFAAGAAFILVETLYQYVPNQIVNMQKAANNDIWAGYLFGIGLLIPRVLQGVAGHMAWAGIFGY